MAHHITFLWIISILLLQNSVLAEDGEIRSSKNYWHCLFFFFYQHIDWGNEIKGAQVLALRILFFLSLML